MLSFLSVRSARLSVNLSRDAFLKDEKGSAPMPREKSFKNLLRVDSLLLMAIS
jgi:hypothetical protein